MSSQFSCWDKEVRKTPNNDHSHFWSERGNLFMQIYTQKGKAYDEFYSAEVPLPSQSTKQLSNGAPKQPEYPAHIRFRDCAEDSPSVKLTLQAVLPPCSGLSQKMQKSLRA